MNKIGLFFGSFDPVHIGHINAVREILSSYIYLDEIWVIPAAQNPHKSHAPVDWITRYTMCEQAFKPFGDRVKVDNVEGWLQRRSMSTKTYDVIDALKKWYPLNEYYIIMEYMELGGIQFWHKGEDIVSGNNFIITFRYSDTIRNAGSGDKIDFCEEQGHEVYELDVMDILEVSSSKIRQEIYEGNPIYPLVPESVIKIIKENNLYAKLSD